MQKNIPSFLFVQIILSTLFILLGCSAQSFPESSTSIPLTEIPKISPTQITNSQDELICSDMELLCILLITVESNIHDNHFNPQVKEAVERSRLDLLARVSHIKVDQTDNIEDKLTPYGIEQYDIILTVGHEMTEATISASRNFPLTHFIAVDQEISSDFENISVLIFPEYEIGFVGGIAAASLTKNNVVGAVFPSKTRGEVDNFRLGFEEGVQTLADKKEIQLVIVNQPIREPILYAIDPNWGAIIADQMLEQNVDVVFSGGGIAGDAVLNEVAKKSNAWCIGSIGDQWVELPDAQSCIVTSVMNRVSLSIFELIARNFILPNEEFVTHEFTGEVDLAPWRSFDELIRADAKELISSAKDQVNQDIEERYDVK